jgi:hypothetical protein
VTVLFLSVQTVIKKVFLLSSVPLRFVQIVTSYWN